MSRPEDRLEELARLAREQETQNAALEGSAVARGEGDAPPSAAESELPSDLVRPLSAQRQAAIVEAIAERVSDGARPVAGSRRPFVSYLNAGRMALIGVAAAAAALFFWAREPADPDQRLALYQVRVTGTQAQSRAAPAMGDLLRVAPGTMLQFELRPEADVRGAVAARVFLLRRDAGTVGIEELKTTQEQSDSGSVRATARVPRDLPSAGTCVLLVGRTAEMQRFRTSDLANEQQAASVQRFQWEFVRAPEQPQ